MKNNNLELYQKLINKNAHISIIGLGYVGLPLLLSLGKEGFKMTGIDIDNNKISDLKNNKSYISDISVGMKGTRRQMKLQMTLVTL